MPARQVRADHDQLQAQREEQEVKIVKELNIVKEVKIVKKKVKIV